jgi:tetratricopeptide (TPR) repeat protein
VSRKEAFMKHTGSRLVSVLGTGVLIITFAFPVAADWNKGVEAYKARDYSAAVQEFSKVVEQSPDHAGSHYMLGISLRGAGQYSKAVASLRKAAELDPSNTSYAIDLGQTLVQMEEYQEAYVVLKKIRYNGLDAQTKQRYAPAFATAAIRAGLPTEAIPVLEAQTRANPRDAGLFYSLGYAHNANGDSVKAFQAFNKAYELKPSQTKYASSAIKSAISAGRRSQGSQKDRYYAQGAAIAESLAQAKPTFDNTLLAGEAYLGAGNYGKALQWFEKAKASQSQNALVRFYLSQCHTSLNQFDDALNEAQEALKIGVSGKLRNQVYGQMGFIYDKTKSYDKAIVAYRNAGNSSKVRDMENKKAAAEQNQAAAAEQAEYERMLRALEEQIKELEAIGEMEEAAELRQHLEKIRSGG